MRTLLIFIVIFADLRKGSRGQGGHTVDDCITGDTWADANIKLLCDVDGIYPVACLPSNEVGVNELLPGHDFINGDIKYFCGSNMDDNGDIVVTYDPVACVLPTKELLDPGQQKGIANMGLFECVRGVGSLLTLKQSDGCYYNGALYNLGQVFKSSDGTSQITCVKGVDGFSATASGCLLPTGQVIQLNAYAVQGLDKVRCMANTADKSVASLVKVSEAEYQAWLAGQNSGTQVSGVGGKVTAQRKTTLTTTTSRTTPTTTTTRTTTTTTTTTTTPTTTTTTPTTTTTESTTTKTAAPETAPPSTAAPDTTPAPTAAPETAPPSTAAPDTTPAPTAAPDTAPPSTAAPDTTPAPTAAPETAPPSTAPPETTKASTAAPETAVPETSPAKTPAPTAAPDTTSAPTTAAPTTFQAHCADPRPAICIDLKANLEEAVRFKDEAERQYSAYCVKV